MVVVASVASAQNYNAFKQLDGVQGISVTENGQVFTVSLGADPTVSIKGKTSEVKDITGFWLLSSKGGLNGSLEDASGYQIKSNSGGGTSADGWFTQNKNGLLPGQSMSFTAKSFNASSLTDFGFMLHANGVPAHVKIEAHGQPVPEPATMGALLLGAIGLVRRRVKSA